MPMGRALGVVVLAAGIILLGFGLNASDAPVEQLQESFTGSYSDRTMWYLIGGAATACGGLALLLLGRRA